MKRALLGMILLAIQVAGPEIPAPSAAPDPPPLDSYAVSVGHPPNWLPVPEDGASPDGQSPDGASPSGGAAVGSLPDGEGVLWPPTTRDFVSAWAAEQALVLPPP